MSCFPAVHLAIYYYTTSSILSTIYTYMIPIMSTFTTTIPLTIRTTLMGLIS